MLPQKLINKILKNERKESYESTVATFNCVQSTPSLRTQEINRCKGTGKARESERKGSGNEKLGKKTTKEMKRERDGMGTE